MNATESPLQAVKERWNTAGRFADVLEAEIKARRSPLEARVVTWLNLCRLTQDIEEQLLLAREEAASEVQLHRALLSLAISGGEGLLLECGDDAELAPLSIGSDSIRAKLESLRITFEQWHTEANLAQQQAILQEVFGGAA